MKRKCEGEEGKDDEKEGGKVDGEETQILADSNTKKENTNIQQRKREPTKEQVDEIEDPKNKLSAETKRINHPGQHGHKPVLQREEEEER